MLSAEIKRYWSEHGLSNSEIDRKIMQLIASILPSTDANSINKPNLQKVFETLFQKPRAEVCAVLNQIVAELDRERSQLKMNEEEESAKSLKKAQSAKK